MDYSFFNPFVYFVTFVVKVVSAIDLHRRMGIDHEAHEVHEAQHRSATLEEP